MIYIVWVTKSEPLEPDGFVAAGAHPGFCSMKRLGVFVLPLDGMLQCSPSQVTPPQLFSFPQPVPIYTPEWREAL